MTNNTAVLINLYNEFLHPDGKLYGKVADSVSTNNTLPHVQEPVATARKHHISIYYCMHQLVHSYTFTSRQHDRPQSDTLAGGSFQANTFCTVLYAGLGPSVANNDVVASKH